MMTGCCENSVVNKKITLNSQKLKLVKQFQNTLQR